MRRGLLLDRHPRMKAGGGRRRAAPGGVVVVTGGSAGVGRAAAREFARQGRDVAILARGRDAVRATTREVEAAGRRALGIPVDVADPDAVQAAADRIERELGPIGVWVNNAMTSVFSPIRQMRAAEYRRVTEVNYLGYVHGTLAVLPRMLGRDSGVIVQVSSALAFRSIPLQSAYCGSKHAIIGFTDSLRAELLHDGSNVRVTAVHLPGVDTTQFRWVRNRMGREAQPVGKVFTPELAAEAIAWAAEHAPRDVVVGSPVALALLGQKVAPGLMDHVVAHAAWEAQLLDEAVPPARPDNLFSPVPGDHGAHGPYGERAHARSAVVSLQEHASVLSATAGGAGLLLGAVLTAMRLRHR